MEAHFHTQKSAPLIIGGIPDEENKVVNYAIELPGMLSFLALGNTAAEVKGLDSIPEEYHPPVSIVHYAFQIMVGVGGVLMLLSVFFFSALWRRKLLDKKWFLSLFVLQFLLAFWLSRRGGLSLRSGVSPGSFMASCVQPMR